MGSVRKKLGSRIDKLKWALKYFSTVKVRQSTNPGFETSVGTEEKESVEYLLDSGLVQPRQKFYSLRLVKSGGGVGGRTKFGDRRERI